MTDFDPPFPAPVISSRQNVSFLPPAPVLSLAEFAWEHSWEVRTQYSRGRMPHGTTGRPGLLKDFVALRFGGHPVTERRAYAVYSRGVLGGTWSWTSVAVWGPDLTPYLGCGVTELKAYLMKAPDSSAEGLAEWVWGLKEIAKNGALLAKRRADGRKMILDLAGRAWTSESIYAAAKSTHTPVEVDKILANRGDTNREGMR